MGANSMENVFLCQALIIQDLINAVIPYEIPETLQNKPDPTADNNETKDNDLDNAGDKNEITEEKEEPEAEEEFDPIAAAVASIMGTEGKFDMRKSPVKPVVTQSVNLVPARPISMPPLVH